ncbi:DNA repair protein RecO [Mycoplasmopsis cricetuli]|uniref:DNA repair protein RecO n=1 Tax=Mycoplasmopsis cricetuli TaxID=171283 RepID=UPI000471000D|nr:DNA repair protein RecO [Mycoplasmopsis cricetuli]
MAISINKAILISQKEISDNEFILKFLTSKGQISLLAQGLKKINSKNRNNLLEGALCEIEYFAARLINKIGRLKKVTLIGQYDIFNEKTFVLLNRIVKLSKQIYFQNSIVNLYWKIIDYFNDSHIHIFLNLFYVHILKYFNYQVITNTCAKCHSNKNIVSFNYFYNGFLCKNELMPFYMSNILLENIYNLYNDEIKYLNTCSKLHGQIIYYLITKFCLTYNIVNF